MPPPAELVCSPYDPEARYSTKRGDLEWVGYKVHLTETCDPDTPRLLTNVETTPATTPDDNILASVHAALAARDRLPAEHLVDTGPRPPRGRPPAARPLRGLAAGAAAPGHRGLPGGVRAAGRRRGHACSGGPAVRAPPNRVGQDPSPAHRHGRGD
jgi:hypothetical protein